MVITYKEVGWDVLTLCSVALPVLCSFASGAYPMKIANWRSVPAWIKKYITGYKQTMRPQQWNRDRLKIKASMSGFKTG